MTARKGKEKTKGIEPSKRGRTRQITESVDKPQSERTISRRGQINQRTPSTDLSKFSNLYSELKFFEFQKRSLHVERKLQILPEMRKFTDDWIDQRGWKCILGS
ncbi:uncharacterized protein DS421_3g104470 [Arachis hypogaea]|nr:uncharacterized protein DS421_3g104470 [Arachis hypogaea]